jgi:hypothetical protein
MSNVLMKIKKADLKSYDECLWEYWVDPRFANVAENSSCALVQSSRCTEYLQEEKTSR